MLAARLRSNARSHSDTVTVKDTEAGIFEHLSFARLVTDPETWQDSAQSIHTVGLLFRLCAAQCNL